MKTYITMSSKGQFTLPAEARKALELDAGDVLEVHINAFMRTVQLTKSLPLDELHKMNRKVLEQNKASLKGYRSGDGFRAHVAKKYGS